MTCNAVDNFEPSLSSVPGRDVASLLRARRKDLGLSLQSVAKKVGCARSYLSMIETRARGGETSAVNQELLQRLEGALHLPGGVLTRAAQWSSTPPGVKR